MDKYFDPAEETVNVSEKNLTGVKVHVNHVEHDCVPFSIRQYRGFNTTEQVDLQRKLLEDPLFMIKQKKIERRKKFIENPVKLKELQQMLKAEHKNNKNLSLKKKKVKKSTVTEKKSTHKSLLSQNGRGDKYLEKLLLKRLIKFRDRMGIDEKFMIFNLTKLLNAKCETILKEFDKSKKLHEQKKTDTNKAEQNSNNKKVIQNSLPRIRSPKYENIHSNRHSTSRSRSREPTNRNAYQNSTSDYKFRGKNSDTKGNSNLSENLKEERRRKMMDNAVWRDEERTSRVRKQREDLKKEEHSFQTTKYDENFISKQVRNAISNQTNVESRIRSNLNNVQRTSAAMSKFTKK